MTNISGRHLCAWFGGQRNILTMATVILAVRQFLLKYHPIVGKKVIVDKIIYIYIYCGGILKIR